MASALYSLNMTSIVAEKNKEMFDSLVNIIHGYKRLSSKEVDAAKKEQYVRYLNRNRHMLTLPIFMFTIYRIDCEYIAL